MILLQHENNSANNVITAIVALLLPVEEPDFERACQLANSVAEVPEMQEIESGSSPPAHLAKALADYRRGYFESADAWARQITADSDADKYHAAAAWIIRSMAAARQQQAESARNALAKADELLSKPHVDFLGSHGGYGQWTTVGLLRREAADLLGITESTDD
jgi:hypothetical protein